MRKIIFRGKDIDGNWIHGDLIHGVGNYKGDMFILPIQENLSSVPNCDPLNGVRIDKETIGQFTGLKDSKGVEIYEGDIVKSPLGNTVEVLFGCKEHIVDVPKKMQRFIGSKSESYQCYGWIVKDKNGNTDFMDDGFINGVVIGNIYDNKNLLEVK